MTSEIVFGVIVISVAVIIAAVLDFGTTALLSVNDKKAKKIHMMHSKSQIKVTVLMFILFLLVRCL